MLTKEEILRDIALNVADVLSQKPLLNYGLLGGDFGDILFLYHYSKTDSHYEAIADNLLEKMMLSLNRQPQVATYCSGLAGLGVAFSENNETYGNTCELSECICTETGDPVCVVSNVPGCLTPIPETQHC